VAVGRVRINPEDVVHETVDGEVILIALQTGSYYSLEGAGAEVWAGLEAGRHVDEIASELEARYAAEHGAIRRAVADLVDRLVSEQLVEADDAPAAAQATNGDRPSLAASAPAFPPPVLHKFTDMQDFLLVDPIHEVGDAGWPHAPAQR
jgi:hypothetical protein